MAHGDLWRETTSTNSLDDYGDGDIVLIGRNTWLVRIGPPTPPGPDPPPPPPPEQIPVRVQVAMEVWRADLARGSISPAGQLSHDTLAAYLAEGLPSEGKE